MKFPLFSQSGSALLFPSLFVAAVCGQGPLTPPAPPSPTMKSLSQVDARVATAGERIPVNETTCPGDAGSAYVISQSGSYFLTGDVPVASAINGITVSASNVTLDLNGYEVTGPGQAGLTGVLVAGQMVTVRNGRSTGWQNGFQADAANVTFEGLMAARNSGTGFLAPAGSTRFDGCSASFNGNNFYAGGASLFVKCSSRDGAFRGFEMGGGSLAVGCTSQFDGVGFVLNGPGDVARDCAASFFGLYGFEVAASGAGSSLQHCSASTNSGGPSAGFHVTGPATMVVDCSARYAGDSSGGLTYGFDGGGAFGATFLRCTALGWSGAGFSTDASTTISGCNAVANGGDGIVFTSGCAVTGNTVSQNGGEGLSGTDADNRIDGNTSTNNGVSGIRSYSDANVIVRNIARNNAVDYNPPSSVNTGPVGQTPGGTVTSPWANF